MAGLLGNVPNFGLLDYQRPLTPEQARQMSHHPQTPLLEQVGGHLSQQPWLANDSSTVWGDAAIAAGLGPEAAMAAHTAYAPNWLTMADDAGQHWGDKTLDATGSPLAATAVHTGMSVFGDPVDLVPALKLGGLASAGAGSLAWLLKHGGDLSDVRKIAPKNQLGAIAYHGSPHRINNVDEANPMGRFDLSKIGTGEGAQAYGHGIYLAENKGVAESYRGSGGIASDAKLDAAKRMRETVTDEDKAGILDRMIGGNYLRESQIKDFANEQSDLGRHDLAKWIREDVEPAIFSPTSLYEVDLPDDKIAQMLDWDAPLSEQPESVRKALEGYINTAKAKHGGNMLLARHEVQLLDELVNGGATVNGGEYKGWGIYSELSDAIGREKASQLLNDAGIPGIKYLDGNSRNAGEGTRNFVIFNPDDAKILSRNGERATLPVQQAQGKAASSGWETAPDLGGGFGRPPVEADDYYYHVTSAPNAKRITEAGLTTGNAPTAGRGGAYGAHSKGKSFLTDADGVEFWKERIEAHLFDQFDDPPDVVVMRIKKSDVGELPIDEVGTKDARANAFMSDKPIAKQAQSLPMDEASRMAKMSAGQSGGGAVGNGEELWSKKFAAEVAEAREYDGKGYDAATRANLEAVPRALKKQGWTLRHTSGKGRASSRYLRSPDGEFEIRLSDHYLPGRSWHGEEMVISGTESPQEIIDDILRIYRDQ